MNIFTGINGVVAKNTISFDSAGLNAGNTAIIYLVSTTLKSYIPGRDINGITGFESGKGYYFVAKQDMDLSAYLIPPVPTSGGGDVTAPTIASKNTTDATHVAIVFSEVVTTSGVTGFSFRKNGSALAASAVSGSGTNTLTFTVGTIANGDTLDVSYNPSTGNCQDGSGNELATVSNSAITNNVSGVATDFSAEFTGTNGTALSAYTPGTGTISNIVGSPTLDGSDHVNIPASASFSTANLVSAGFKAKLGVTSFPDGGSTVLLLATSGASNIYLQVDRAGTSLTLKKIKDDNPLSSDTVLTTSGVKEIILLRSGNTITYKYSDASFVEQSLGTADITGYTFTSIKTASFTGASVIDYLVVTH